MEQSKLQPTSHEHRKSSLQRIKPQSQLKKHTKTLVREGKVKKNCSVLRRSGRIRNTVLSSQSRSCPVIEEITLSESEDDKEEEEEEEPHAGVEKNVAESIMREKTVFQKIGYIAQLLKPRDTTSPTVKHPAIKNPSCTRYLSTSDLTYKSMYLDSQKKIQEQKEEIRELTQKLDNSLFKLEVYEKCTRNFSEMLEKLKDGILVLSLRNISEAAIDVQSQALHNATSPGLASELKTSGSRRKKVSKRS